MTSARSYLHDSLKNNEFINEIVSKIAKSTEQDIREINSNKMPAFFKSIELVAKYLDLDNVYHVFALNTNISKLFTQKEVAYLKERCGCAESIVDILVEVNSSLEEDNFCYFQDVFLIPNYDVLLIDKLVMFKEDEGKIIDNFDGFSIADKQEMLTAFDLVQQDITIEIDFPTLKNQNLANYLQNSIILE